MKLRYGLDDRPPPVETALQALQWLAISLPFVVIASTVAAGHGPADPAWRAAYLQKAALVTGAMMLAQAAFGHRLTLVAAPSTALLLGIVGTRSEPAAVYTAIALCGAATALLSAAGLFGALRRAFTPRVTAAVLLLIAFSLTPTIVRLLTSGPGAPPDRRLAFAGAFVLALFVAHRLLPAAARSLLIVAGMAAGTVFHILAFGMPVADGALPQRFDLFFAAPGPFRAEPGAVLSIAFCFLALWLNEVGSIQSIAALLAPGDMDRRLRRGMTVMGAVNAVAGFLGVIGPVDISLSPGVVAATGCGSRRPLLFTGAFLAILSCFPVVLGGAALVPHAVVGGILLYTLSGQVAAGLSVAFAGGAFAFEDGLVVGLPLLAGTVAAILPPDALSAFPDLIRPVAGNGFVVGVVAVLLLDRIFSPPRTSK